MVRREEELAAKRQQLAALFTKDANGEYNMSAEVVDEIQRRSRELEDLQAKYEQARQLAAIEGGVAAAAGRGREVQPEAGHVASGRPARQLMSLGDLFVGSRAYQAFRSGRKDTGDLEEIGYDPGFQLRATTMTRAAGFAPESLRTGRVVDAATRPPRVIDAYPMAPTTQAAVVFMRETTFTNNAAEAAESSGSAGEAALAYTQITSTVQKIAVHLPVTEEQLADVEGMRERIDNRLELMLRQRLDVQLVSGNGTAPNLEGILNTTGIQTQAKGTDPAFDAIFKAITLVRFTGFAEPDALILHPNDWQDIRLTRTTDGIYILGNPGDVGPERLWGLPVYVSTAATENTGIVGDYMGYAEVAYRQGVEFAVTDSHGTDFLGGVLRVKATLRVAHVVYRPAAFCAVTGL